MPSATASEDLSVHNSAPAEQYIAKAKLPALIPRKRRVPLSNPLPAAETPCLPDPSRLSDLSFQTPIRRILSPRDHDIFLQSSTYSLVVSFVFSLSDACVDTKISSIILESQPHIIQSLVSILSSISSLVDANPPVDQGTSRFGNPAFRGLIGTLISRLGDYHASLGLPTPESIIEASAYLAHAFGSGERIDYGSGHELNFMLWLLCLNRMSLLHQSTFRALALLIFPQYIRLLRKIQSTYYLEPAGSHGVWGLDDYHFLPFLFGASQLLHHPYIRPLSIHNDLVLEEEGDEYMYLDMVRWTMATKTVKGLKWTQPMLDDISGAKNWEKVEQGMRRMFLKEVLGKLPIMQHFLFGSLIPADEMMGQIEARDVSGNTDNSAGHTHHDDQWGDCCGIKIPSTVAAAQEAQKTGAGQVLRRIPFD